MNAMNASCPTHWQHATTHCNALQHTATHCNTLPHTATNCHTLQHAATHCNTLQHTATHCNILQHTATCCNTLQIFCLACGCLLGGMALVCMNVYMHTYEPLTPPPPCAPSFSPHRPPLVKKAAFWLKYCSLQKNLFKFSQDHTGGGVGFVMVLSRGRESILAHTLFFSFIICIFLDVCQFFCEICVLVCVRVVFQKDLRAAPS